MLPDVENGPSECKDPNPSWNMCEQAMKDLSYSSYLCPVLQLFFVYFELLF